MAHGAGDFVACPHCEGMQKVIYHPKYKTLGIDCKSSFCWRMRYNDFTPLGTIWFGTNKLVGDLSDVPEDKLEEVKAELDRISKLPKLEITIT